VENDKTEHGKKRRISTVTVPGSKKNRLYLLLIFIVIKENISVFGKSIKFFTSVKLANDIPY